MMNTRRRLLQFGLAASIGSALPIRFVRAQAQQDGPDYNDVSTPFPASYRLFGTSPALGPEEDAAREILAAAPKSAALLETARYFEELDRVNKDGYRYNAQWPYRWNPVIIGFYQSTSLPQPYVYRKGDTIDWCAAFINWCLIQGGYAHTGSAMSGSFRLGKALGKATLEPKIGDIIVFKKADPKQANVGFGHVGIFVGHTKDGFSVLGGNQYAGKKYSSVTTVSFPEKSDKLILDSFRSLASIPRKST